MSSRREIDNEVPVVLAVGGHDPVGGAGIQADIEAIAALGGHAATAVTCLTVQDTVNVLALHPVESRILRAQIKAVLDDLPVNVIKVGLLGSVAAVNALADALETCARVPVVLDPVLAAGGGAELSDETLIQAIRVRLLPVTFLLTPNTREAARLAGEPQLEAAASVLLERGVCHLLVSGGHEQGDEIVNRYYGPEGVRDLWRWPRLPGEYHGSGCTLASACAALLARGLPLGMAMRLAQAFTHDALARAHRSGRGQALPRRVPGGRSGP